MLVYEFDINRLTISFPNRSLISKQIFPCLFRLLTPSSAIIDNSDIGVNSVVQPIGDITPDIGYILSGPISIDGNADFVSQASAYGWDFGGSRSGNYTHPFTISGFEFNGFGGDAVVNITNTDVYFLFSGNNVHNASGGTGLWMKGVKNAIIEFNTIHNTIKVS